MRLLPCALALLLLAPTARAGSPFFFCPFGGPPGWAERLAGHRHRRPPPPPPPPPAMFGWPAPAPAAPPPAAARPAR